MILQGSSGPPIVFVSIPNSLPDALSSFLNKGQELGIDVRVYSGLDNPPAGRTSNIHEEARGDMFEATWLFVAAAHVSAAEIHGDWIIKQSPALASCGVKVDVGLLGLSVEEFASRYDFSVLYSTFRIEPYSSGGEWEAYVLDNLRKIAGA